MDDSFDFGMKKLKTEGELEVTGVSRSGRVRKKSSKLTDFENLDELDMRTPKSKKEKQDFSTPSARYLKKEKNPVKEEILSDEDEVDTGNFPVKPEQIFLKEENFSDMECENDVSYGNGDSSMDSLGSDIDDLDNPIEREDDEGFQPIVDDSDTEYTSQKSYLNQYLQRRKVTLFHVHLPRAIRTVGKSQRIKRKRCRVCSQSLYMMEKSNKKKLVIKDGKIVGRMKAHRKDKGKTRFTAYMLWAKEIRSELMKHNPDLDFSQTSKKLGELWSSVPFHEKYIWKRRAKRLAARGMTKQAQQQPAQQHQQIINSSVHEVKKIKSPPIRKYVNKQNVTSPTASNTIISSPETPKSNRSSLGVESSVFKPVGTTPLDVAAHLRLLGESLTIIGERLTEHEGQIAVSGSISVLLDSLLCALAPLMCLTQQVPQMNVIPQDQLSQTMDNIAYLMPGL